jgi:cysteine-rich repeat protein
VSWAFRSPLFASGSAFAWTLPVAVGSNARMHERYVVPILAAALLGTLSTSCTVEPPIGPGFTSGPLETTGYGDGDGDGDPGDGDADPGDGDGDGDAPACGDGNVDPGEECDDANMDDTDACTSACSNAACGDGFVQAGVETCDDGNTMEDDGCGPTCMTEDGCGDGVVAGMEECDDGNALDTDDCTSMCLAAVCGDGLVHTGVEECDDSNMVDTDACTSACTDAVCGDNAIHAGVEDCDDGNMDDTDACVGMCTPAVCGDGFVHMGVEDCDDANADPGDGCSGMCELEYRLVFATSTTTDGNLGGLAGADMICQTRAAAANLSGTYMAWISTDQGSPSTRFIQSTVAYQLVTGIKVADSWADLVDGTIDNAINRTESGAPSVNSIATCGASDRTVHSGTTDAGTLAADTCNNFTSGIDVDLGTIGRTTSTNGSWADCSSVSCDQAAALYCFQQ